MDSSSEAIQKRREEWIRTSTLEEYGAQKVLRIWGHADNLEIREVRDWANKEEPWTFNICLDGHEYILELNAANAPERPSVYLTPISQDLAARHTTVHLDRFSQPKSYLPFIQQIHPWYIGDGRQIVLVYLFDRRGCDGDPDLQTMSWFLRESISRKVLLKAVQEYLRPGSSADPKETTASVIIQKQGGGVDTNIITRGRLRRRNLRHGIKRSGTKQSNISSTPLIHLRGRVRRRAKRHGLGQQKATDNQLQQTTKGPEPNPSTSPVNTTNLVSRLPENLKRLPRIMFFGKSRGDLSDAIVIPLMAPYDTQKVLGSLVFPRSYVLAMQNDYYGTEKPAEELEWMFALRTGPPNIKVTSFVTQGSGHVPGLDKDYWRKFDLGLVAHLRSNDVTMKGRYQLNVFDLSFWSSFGHPLITYPDCSLGPIAEEREYHDLFDCFERISPTKNYEAPELITWIKRLDFQRHQALEGFEKDEKYGIFKVRSYQNPAWKSNAIATKLETRGNFAALALNTAAYYYALKEFEDQMMSKKDWIFRPPETDEDLALNMAKEVDRMKILTSEQSEKETSSLLQLLYRMEKREMWHGAWEQSHIPLWQLEKILFRIKSLAHSNDPELATRVKTYAVFQYGICLLAGFGVLQDIDNGLSWVRQSAIHGCRAAQAVVHGLYRAYNREHNLDKDQALWLIEETKSFSEYAQYELGIVSGASVATNTRRRLLYAAKYEVDDPWTGMIVPLDDAEKEFFGFFNARLLSRLALYSPQYLTRQLELRDEGSLEALIPILSEEAPDEKPALFYRALMRWACCFAEMPTFDVIAEKGIGFIWRDELQEFLQLALLRGHAKMAMYFLEQEVMTARDEKMAGLEALGSIMPGRNPLFLLHHIPDDEVGPVVQKIVSLGFSINSKAKVVDVETQAVYPVSQGHGFYYKKAWDMHLRDEIRGESITPLRWAIAKNKAGLVRALIDAGAESPLQPDRRQYAQTMPDKWAPDILTVRVLDQPCYNIDILHMFFGKHGDQQGEPVFAESPLGLIAMEPDSPRRRLRIAQHLDGGPECLFQVLSLIREYQSENDAELFWAAAMNGHEDIIRYLILQGVDIELRWKGMTPLHTAILHGRSAIVSLLLANGADPWAVTSATHISSLHLLFWKEKPERVELAIFDKLYEILRDVSGRHSDFGNTVSPLHLAVLNSRVKAVERLIQLGADTSMVLRREIMTTMIGEQYTARGIQQQIKREAAAKYGSMNDQNVPLRHIAIAGYTAAGIILLREDMFLPEQASEMLKLLVSTPKGGIARFYTRPDIKQTILHLLSWSALREKTDILDWMLDAGKNDGLDLNTRDVHGDTPMHYAYAALGPEIIKDIKYFTTRGADLTLTNTSSLSPSDMRSHTLTQTFKPSTHPLEIHLTIGPPFTEDQMQRYHNPQPPHPETLHIDNSQHTNASQPLWSLEDWAFSGPQIWDCKTRRMVDVPAQRQMSAPGNPNPYVYTEQEVMVQLKTPGWSGNVSGGSFQRVMEADVVLDIPDDVHGGPSQVLPHR